jgi:hypothetical protein
LKSPDDLYLGSDIDKIRDLAEQFLSFRYERRESEEWSMFYGCIDSLRDVDDALHSILNLKRRATYLECVGFLISLVTQQEAVKFLSRSVGADFNPSDDENLRRIRDVRNRVAGHSAWAERNGKSTSMINHADIHETGFSAVVYRSPSSKTAELYTRVNFKEFVLLNVTSLKLQMGRVAIAMANREEELRSELQSIDWSFWDESETYLFEKLWYPWQNDRVWQAADHIRIFNEKIAKLISLKEQQYLPEVSQEKLDENLIILGLIQDLLSKSYASEEDRVLYDTLLIGWDSKWSEIKNDISRLRGLNQAKD